jgi:hypothetical protein
MVTWTGLGDNTELFWAVSHISEIEIGERDVEAVPPGHGGSTVAAAARGQEEEGKAGKAHESSSVCM